MEVWSQLLPLLRQRLSAEQYSMWIQPLRVHCDKEVVQLFAPNRFVLDWVREKYHQLLLDCLSEVTDGDVKLSFEFKLASVTARGVEGGSQTLSVDNRENNQVMGSPRVMLGRESGHPVNGAAGNKTSISADVDKHQVIASSIDGTIGNETLGAQVGKQGTNRNRSVAVADDSSKQAPKHNLKQQYVFENFVEGKSNQLARAAATQVAENPGDAYNPLFLYGGTGLGKTHLLHAVGNGIIAHKPDAKVVYMHSERFVQDMVKALQQNSIDSFKRYYRSVDALLIDDIQFFAKKDRSQEEFFHTFNALLEGNQQIILSSDRYPKEIDGVEDRLKSRFGWGLTVIIEPPELETRVAILNRKALENGVDLPSEVSFFIAKRLRSNVRELEGALNRVIANSKFTRRPINIEFVRDALGDLLALQDKLITISNIQKMVADYYRIKVSDLLSKSRSRKVARPRQLAMALAKELTNHSFPEIGNQFGGRDHTTVLHACRKIEELKRDDHDIKEDYKNLLRTLSS